MNLAETIEALANLTGRLDRVVQGFEARVKSVEASIEAVMLRQDALTQELVGLMTNEDTRHAAHRATLGEIFESLSSLQGEASEIGGTMEDLADKVNGRNKSAALKRNMTDVDALKVLTGPFKDMGHKEASEMIGLTYAQVYSCRLGYTFKHVHHVLRIEKWQNPWEKTSRK